MSRLNDLHLKRTFRPHSPAVEHYELADFSDGTPNNGIIRLYRCKNCMSHRMKSKNATFMMKHLLERCEKISLSDRMILEQYDNKSKRRKRKPDDANSVTNSLVNHQLRDDVPEKKILEEPLSILPNENEAFSQILTAPSVVNPPIAMPSISNKLKAISSGMICDMLIHSGLSVSFLKNPNFAALLHLLNCDYPVLPTAENFVLEVLPELVKTRKAQILSQSRINAESGYAIGYETIGLNGIDYSLIYIIRDLQIWFVKVTKNGEVVGDNSLLLESILSVISTIPDSITVRKNTIASNTTPNIIETGNDDPIQSSFEHTATLNNSTKKKLKFWGIIGERKYLPTEDVLNTDDTVKEELNLPLGYIFSDSNALDILTTLLHAITNIKEISKIISQSVAISEFLTSHMDKFSHIAFGDGSTSENTAKLMRMLASYDASSNESLYLHLNRLVQFHPYCIRIVKHPAWNTIRTTIASNSLNNDNNNNDYVSNLELFESFTLSNEDTALNSRISIVSQMVHLFSKCIHTLRNNNNIGCGSNSLIWPLSRALDHDIGVLFSSTEGSLFASDTITEITTSLQEKVTELSSNQRHIAYLLDPYLMPNELPKVLNEILYNWLLSIGISEIEASQIDAEVVSWMSSSTGSHISGLQKARQTVQVSPITNAMYPDETSKIIAMYKKRPRNNIGDTAGGWWKQYCMHSFPRLTTVAVTLLTNLGSFNGMKSCILRDNEIYTKVILESLKHSQFEDLLFIVFNYMLNVSDSEMDKYNVTVFLESCAQHILNSSPTS